MSGAVELLLPGVVTKNAQLQSIRRHLAQLKARGDESPRVREIEATIESLATNLEELETAAMRRDEATSQRKALLRNAFAASSIEPTTPSQRIGRVDLGAVVLGKAHEGEDVGFRIIHQSGEFGHLGPELVGHLAPLGASCFGIVLNKRGADKGGGDAAALPAGIGQDIA